MPSRLMRLAALASCLTIVACSGTRPAYLGIEKNSLEQCPDSPNCVTSVASPDDAQHFIEPINIQTNKAPMPALEGIIKSQGGAIVVNTPTYIYAEFTSDIIRFVDDVEFLLQPQAKHIEVRSASRLGYKDFDVNRERIEKIRSEFNR
jgi:uncharacterized protein (DUF1499 family)